MSDYIGKCRSNYFHVKDRAAFEEWCGRYDLKALEQDASMEELCAQYVMEMMEQEAEAKKNESPKTGRVGFCSEDALPDVYIDADDNLMEVAALDTLPELLAEGEIAVVMEVGSEAMRYLRGYAAAVNWKGEMVQVDLDDIYHRLTEISNGVRAVTPCQY